jgi:exosortase
MVISRSQDILLVEATTQIVVLIGCVLIAGGWPLFRALRFPIAFLIFSIPPPGWMLDALTVPLKTMVSDIVADALYRFGYPVAQNGVMIMVGPYELMVKDACSGMNSIFALSAIGVFYVHEFVRDSILRKCVLIASIIPITIVANMLRVGALVLTAYYAGVGAVEGLYHELTGVVLFIVALLSFFAIDGVLMAFGRLFRRRYRGPDNVQSAT